MGYFIGSNEGDRKVISFFIAKEAHKPPVFVEKLQNTGVAEGYPVRLECRVSGVPHPQIFWKKENESLTYNTDRVRLVLFILSLCLTLKFSCIVLVRGCICFYFLGRFWICGWSIMALGLLGWREGLVVSWQWET